VLKKMGGGSRLASTCRTPAPFSATMAVMRSIAMGRERVGSLASTTPRSSASSPAEASGKRRPVTRMFSSTTVPASWSVSVSATTESAPTAAGCSGLRTTTAALASMTW
jgi:hypothetical protein